MGVYMFILILFWATVILYSFSIILIDTNLFYFFLFFCFISLFFIFFSFPPFFCLFFLFYSFFPFVFFFFWTRLLVFFSKTSFELCNYRLDSGNGLNPHHRKMSKRRWIFQTALTVNFYITSILEKCSSIHVGGHLWYTRIWIVLLRRFCNRAYTPSVIV